MGTYVRSVLNRKAFHVFPALFLSTSEVPVCKAATGTTSVELLLSVQKTYIQSLFLSFSSLYLSNDWSQVTTSITVILLR